MFRSVAVTLILCLASVAAQAALVTMNFSNAQWFNQNGRVRNFDLSSSTATWEYDTTSQSLHQSGGIFNLTMKLAPTTVVWTHSFTDLIIASVYGGGSASSFTCTEGNYGVYENTNFCGGYKLGENLLDESTATWGPGLAYSRTIGGDDVATYGQWDVNPYIYGGYRAVSWDGSTLVFGNARCLSDCSGMPAGLNNGNLFTLHVVSVPPPIWLFGSALSMMGWMRKKAVA